MGAVVQKKHRDPWEGFEVFKKYKFSGIKLGVGETSQVHEAYDLKSEELYAVKIIVKDEVEIGDRERADIIHECEIMNKLRHPNVCKFYERFEDAELIYFVLEYCEGGTLFEKLEQDAVLEESVAKPMVKEMVGAVAYLHDKGYVHRDLRPENWLLSDITDTASLKLSHFQLTMECRHDGFLTSPCGTLHYVAPEVLRGSYGRASDVWTLGVLVFLMLYGSYPFDGETSNSVMSAILASEADWSNSCYALSADAKGLLKKFLVKDPLQRPTMHDISKHAWLPPRGSRMEPRWSFMSGGKNKTHSAPNSAHCSPRPSTGSLRAPSSAVELKGANGRRASALVTTELIGKLNLPSP